MTMKNQNLAEDDESLLQTLIQLQETLSGSDSAPVAADSALRVLHEGKWIHSGALDIQGRNPTRCVIGDSSRLALEYLAHYKNLAENDPASVTSSSEDWIFFESLPVRFAPRTFMILGLRRQPSKDALRIVSGVISSALDRIFLQDQSRLLRQQANRSIREVSTIYEIGRAMDSMELTQLLEIITEKAAKVMDAQACSLMRLNKDTNALTIAASFGLSDEVVDLAQREIGEGIAGKVAQTGEAMLISDVENDPRLEGVSPIPGIGSSMIVPMKDEKGIVTGVLSIRRKKTLPNFTPDDMRLFSVFASQAALAINNKQLYDDVNHRLVELYTISELTQAVISHLDLNNLLEHVADNIVDVVKFDRCCLYLQDKHTRKYIPRIWRGYKEDVVHSASAKMGEGVIGLVAKKQIPIVEYDIENALQPMLGFARTLGANAFIAIPIISRGQTIGVVVADNRSTERIIRPEAVELLTTFVNQAGIAIENAQLYEDREQRYQEINRLANQTDNILRSMGGGVLVLDSEGKVIRWNNAFEQIWGLTEQRHVELSCQQLIELLGLPPAEANSLEKLIDKCLTDGEAAQHYKQLYHPKDNKRRFLNLLLSPLTDRHGQRQGAVILVEDVTHETLMEQEMNHIRRLADIGEFAAKMAHEVRNPLSSIKGAAQLIRNDYANEAPFREFLDIIIEEVDALSQITMDLLDFARPMSMKVEQTSINELVDRSVRFLNSFIEDAGVKVEYHHSDGLPDIFVDRKQIEQVIRNIIINAVQAMKGGGTLTISTSMDDSSGMVRAQFDDTGCGIPEDKIDKIFQPFFTTKTKGTGLGLSIVKRIVENHNGNIEVFRRESAGTSFRLSLPSGGDLPLIPISEQYTTELPDI